MGQAAWVWPVGSGSGSGPGMRQRVTSKPRAPSLPMWWAISRRTRPALVVVRAEVRVTHAGIGQQLVIDLQLGVPDRDLGLGLAAAAAG